LSVLPLPEAPLSPLLPLPLPWAPFALLLLPLPLPLPLSLPEAPFPPIRVALGAGTTDTVVNPPSHVEHGTVTEKTGDTSAGPELEPVSELEPDSDPDSDPDPDPDPETEAEGKA